MRLGAVILLITCLLSIGLGVILTSMPHQPIQMTSYTLPDVVEQVKDEVVHITAEGGAEGGWQGSGFLVLPDLVCTAGHVTAEEKNFVIELMDGRKIKGVNAIKSKKHDFGFILLEKPALYPCGKPIVARYGKLKDCRWGEQVFIIGGSLGKMHWPNLTTGVISMLDVQPERTGCPPEMGWSITWLTDTASYPGNSGSPVYSLRGDVVGILVGGIGRSECLSYCVPFDIVANDILMVRQILMQDKYEIQNKPKPEETQFVPFVEVK